MTRLNATVARATARRAALLVLLVTSLFIGVPLAPAQGEEEPSFPVEHLDLLSAGAYAMIVGFSPASGGPIPSCPGGPPPRVGANLRINEPQFSFPNGLLGRSETAIATDPSGRFLLAGWNDTDGGCSPPYNAACTPTIPTGPGLTGYGYSTDGGRTWVDAGAPPVVAGRVTAGDPWMDTGGPGRGVYYFANLAVSLSSASPGPGGLVVHRGKFTGHQFAFDHGVFLQSPNAPNDFLDKESVCAGKTGRTKDQVAVPLTNFRESFGVAFAGLGQIEVFTSFDRGTTFPVHTVVEPDQNFTVSDGIVNQGAVCAYGPGGELYVAWERGFLSPFRGQGGVGVFPQIVIARSDDGGHTFGPRNLVSDISAPALFPPDGYSRSSYNDWPRICAATRGRYRGRVYVVYQDSRIANGGTQAQTGGFGHPDGDVYLRYSDDGGVTWSLPNLVAGGGDGLLQFWPAVTCDRADGRVDVVYYESVEQAADSFVDVYLATSDDGGDSFGAPLRVTDVTSAWGAAATNFTPNFGDYLFPVSAGNRVHVTWSDGRNGVPDAFYAKVRP